MKVLSALWALLRGLGGVFSWVSWLGKIPGLGFVLKWTNPFWGLAVTAFQVVWGFISYLLKGLFSILQSPAGIGAAAVIGIAGIAYGFHLGTNWDKALVNRANARLASVQKATGKINVEDASKAADAIEKRKIAEAAERQKIADEQAYTKAMAAAAASDTPPHVVVPKTVKLPTLGFISPTPLAAPKPDAVGVQPVSAPASPIHRRVHKPSLWEGLQADLGRALGIK